ncbi:MAG: type II toxin-antitoxin system antitoxin SocA domain-containing protein [Bacteroidota bacterium]
MNQNISQKELGQRISELRQSKGLSQDDLANQIEISRSSLTQIELGNRKLNVMELQRISYVLGFSLDRFLANNFSAKEFSKEAAKNDSVKDSYRVSEPTFDVHKFSNVLLYISERCAGKPNVGETLIYKLLYFSDFNYYELYEEHLTGARYHKLPYGPVPQNIQAIINNMIEEDKSIKRIKTDYYNYTQTRYIPLKKANLLALKASETEILNHVIEQFSDWSATAISEYAHKDIPWLVSKEGEEINYELALYREAPYSVRNYDQ